MIRGEILANCNSVANGSIDGSDSLKANGVNVEVESESSSSSSSESENEDSSFLDKMKDRVSDAIGVWWLSHEIDLTYIDYHNLDFFEELSNNPLYTYQWLSLSQITIKISNKELI